MRTNNCEPNNIEVNAQLDLQSRLDASKLDWVNAEVMGNPSVMSIVPVVEVVCIMVGDPLEWLGLPVGPNKRACRSFNECAGPLYKCVFTRI